jgi:biopolymer transport protein ExbD
MPATLRRPMRRRLFNQSAHAFEGINVTPLIDVVMCLIVFFLIVGKLASDAATVRLPSSAIGRTDRPGSAVVISVARGDTPGSSLPIDWGGVKARVFIDGQVVGGENELVAAIREKAAALLGVAENGDISAAPVHVRADRDLPYSAVEPVLRAAAKAGVPGVRLATERSS